MKQTIICLCGLFILFSSFQDSTLKSQGYTKDDLKRLRWIEGNWSGLYQQKPFYEIYRFTNDTTLQVTSYEWNGKDSSGTSVTYLVWNNGAYYLGDSLNWKVTQITDDMIIMIPHRKASNEIIWKRVGKDTWDAVLNSKRGETVYNMKRIQHFSK